MAKQAGELLNDPITSWDQAKTPLVGTKVNKFQALLTRIESAQVQSMIEDSKESAPGGVVAAANGASIPAQNPAGGYGGDRTEGRHWRRSRWRRNARSTISRRSIYAWRGSLAAEEVPDARKLLKLTLSLGGDVRKSVFAGIKKAYPQPEKLVGRLVICVANLQPRQMKFGLSEGMVTAAGGGGDEVFLLSPDSGAKPGQRVH